MAVRITDGRYWAPNSVGEDGLSYATNQNNLLLQLKGLSSTEDYVNTTGKPVVEPLAPPPPPPANANSVLDLME
jgi:hypothetical protein